MEKIDDIQKLCRFCLNLHEPEILLTQADVQNFMHTLQLNVEITDEFPKKICKGCYDCILNTSKFKTMVDNNLSYIKDYVNEQNVKEKEAALNSTSDEEEHVTYKCKYCKRAFNEILNMKRHMFQCRKVQKNIVQCHSTNKIKYYSCNLCGYSEFDRNILRRHIGGANCREETILCINNKELDIMKIIKPKKKNSYFCPLCFKLYKTAKSVASHLSTENCYKTKEKHKFSCSYCMTNIENLKEFVNHKKLCKRIENNIVKEEDFFKCYLCDHNSKYKFNIRMHIGSEDCKKKISEILTKEYSDIKNVIEKVSKFDNNINSKFYKCTLCAKTFKSVNEIVDHLMNLNCFSKCDIDVSLMPLQDQINYYKEFKGKT